MEDVSDSLNESNILYELLIYSEWQQETEIQNKGYVEKHEEKFESGYIWKWLGFFSSDHSPSTHVRQLSNIQMPWNFVVGGNGAIVAILQDTYLEIRSSRDEYGAVIGRTLVAKDPYPQWRKILWSPDCTMLVLAHSNGKLDFYDLIGAHMFAIESKNSTKNNIDLGYAIAGMAFSDLRVKNTHWSYELLVANYKGQITGYYISASDGYKESHTFSLSSYYPLGITCFAYDSTSGLILISGISHKLSLISNTNEAALKGISAWRTIIGHPYYKLSLSMSEEMELKKNNWWNLISTYNLYNWKSKQELVYKMSISPNSKLLAIVHTSGTLSLWELPSLRMKKYWSLESQPSHNDINSRFCEPGMRKKAALILSDIYRSHIIDVNWWSNEAIILARRSGAVSISSINSLKNLLGNSPEWFEPSPSITSFYDRGFLALECEIQVRSKKRTVEERSLEDDESSDDDEPSIFAHTAELTQRALYFITDSERFQPPRKKTKLMKKTYRLLCLKSTTPEELYSRKINNEEYGEALALAKTYNLDCDLVYQRQWRKMPATVETIHDYLSKITKRSWVLHECMERVPESFEAAKELLLYGLQGTDLEALIAIGKGEDHGRFIFLA